MNDLLKMRLQLFAEQEEGSDDSGADEQESNEQEEHEGSDKQQEETFTKEQMEDIIKQRVAREKKAAEKAVQEAEKLAKMNEEEKREFEFEKLQKELEEYKKKDTYYSLSKEASKMLADNDIQASDDLLNFVVKDSAEDTQQAVNSFVELLNVKVEEGVKKALSGNSPKVHTNTGKALTKEDILNEKDASKRIKMIQENPNLFK